MKDAQTSESLTRRLTDVNVSIDVGMSPSEQKDMANKLASEFFLSKSHDSVVHVYMSGTGIIDEIAITDDALVRMSAEELSKRLKEAIQSAESTLTETHASIRANSVDVR